MKYKFNIPVCWEVSSEIEIEAASMEEAIQKAHDADLPVGSSYVDGSFEVDMDVAEYLNRDIEEAIKVDNTPYENLPLLIDTLKWDKAKNRLNERLKEGK